MARTIQELEEQHDEIVQLYDLADELAETVDSKFVADPMAQLALMEPLIEQIGASADIMSEEYINLVEQKPSRKTQTRLEGALRKIYVAIDEYNAKVGSATNQAVSSIRNIADPIIARVKAKAEQIIVIFLGFVKLALDRVMHKQELDELKRRRDVDFQLHQMAQQH